MPKKFMSELFKTLEKVSANDVIFCNTIYISVYYSLNNAEKKAIDSQPDTHEKVYFFNRISS
jgi:hypothetical protein